MKSLIIICAALFMMVATPFVFASLDNSLTDEYTQSVSGVGTGAGDYAANVTLGRSIYNDDSVSVLEISSNISSDTPSASAYNSVSKKLEVSGLEASETRTLVIRFLIDSTTLPSGSSIFLTFLRWLWIFVIVGFMGGGVYAFFES